MSDRNVLQIRINDKIKEKEKMVAKEDRRTLSVYVKFLIENDIKKKAGK